MCTPQADEKEFIMTPTKSLPPNPSMQQLRNQAKDLRKAHKVVTRMPLAGSQNSIQGFTVPLKPTSERRSLP
jgi:hypothetical protein